MDRRELLQWSAMAVAAASLADKAFAQGAPAPAPAAKFSLDAYSRNLQWCRTPQDLAKAVVDLGLGSTDLSVGGAGAHVDFAQVKTALPAFVNGLKAGGIAVRCVTLPIVDADSPGAEAALDAAASSGIGYYTWSGLTYEPGKDLQGQINALKPRVQKLAKLNEKYKIKGLYHPVAGVTNVGSSFFDILEVLQTVNPQFTGIQYDTASLLQPVREVFVSHMRLGAPYIGGMALNDAAISLDIPVYEYGPFDPGKANANAGPAGDNTGNADGDPLAFGGGGRPLPYKYRPMRVGTGMIDLIQIGRTLKEIGFNGPIETQVNWPLGGAENGADKISLPRQSVLGQLKRDRLTVEHGFFAAGWNIDIARPAFLVARDRGGAAAAPAGRGGRGGRGAAQ